MSETAEIATLLEPTPDVMEELKDVLAAKEEEPVVEGTRWSGADWGDQQKEILIIGQGGIGSWLAMSLARIGHSLITIDGDTVDETNVKGGQMFFHKDVGSSKVGAVQRVIRELGCNSSITVINEMFKSSHGTMPITMTGLDNMTARKLVYETWKASDDKEIFIDARLTLEMFEILTIQADKPDQFEEYEAKYLFGDEQANIVDCTTKQSTFGAMMVAAMMTSTLCNWLTNKKIQAEFREVPFYQRMILPMLEYKKQECEIKSV